VQLRPLMEATSGAPEVKIGLIDGPVALDHPALSKDHIRELASGAGSACTRQASASRVHGTFIAGVLSATRISAAPAICPRCTLLVRPIFGEAVASGATVPSATPEELAAAIVECVAAGARVLNLSLALTSPSAGGEEALGQALDYAARRGVIAIAAAGNQGMVGSSLITRHPWVIPVAACDSAGRPLGYSNLGNSIGRFGLSAPGESIASLGSSGRTLVLDGTSVAAPFVTGAVALLWSLFPATSAANMKLAMASAHGSARRGVVPPLLNARQAWLALAQVSGRIAGHVATV
jgi:subtilisin family serine protease